MVREQSIHHSLAATKALEKILIHSQDVSIPTKIRIVQAVVFL